MKGYRRVSGATPEADLGKQSESVELNKGDSEDSDYVPPCPTRRDLLLHLKDALASKGWKLVPSPDGDYAGFNVYCKSVPNPTLQLNCPPTFRHWVRIRPSDARSTGFLEAVRVVCDAQYATAGNKTEQVLWRSILSAFHDSPKHVNSSVALTAVGLSEELLKGSVAGVSGCAHYVPLVEWFPEQLHEFDALSMLTLMPEAEARMFMLCWGKTLIGNAGTVLAEGVVPDAKFAALAVLIGFEGGEGKSSLMSMLADAIELMGYKVAAIPDVPRFGDLWVSSHMAWADELGDDAHERLLKSWPSIKSAVAGQKISVEAKGIQPWEVRPTAQPFFCANQFFNTWLQKSDGGSRRRYNPLYCYSSSELQSLHGDNWKQKRVAVYWQQVADSLGVTISCLAARFLKACADYYMEAIGLKVINGQFSWSWSDNNLETTMQELRDAFRIKVDMGHGKRLVASIEMACLAAVKLMDERHHGAVLERIDSLSIMPVALHTVIEIWALGDKQAATLPESLAQLYFDDISTNVRVTWNAQRDVLHADCLSMRNPAELWRRIIESLTVKGKEWHFQGGIATYSEYWNLLLKTFPQKFTALNRDEVWNLSDDYKALLSQLGDQILIALGVNKGLYRRR